MPFEFRAYKGNRGGAQAGTRMFSCCVNTSRSANGQCDRCPRCTAHLYSQPARQCSKPACKDSQLCATHLRYRYRLPPGLDGTPGDVRHIGVAIRPSNIAGAGLGLFATRNFAAGEVIVAIGGVELTKQALSQRYDYSGMTVTAPYGYTNELPTRAGRFKRHYYDAACVRRAGAYSNTHFGDDAAVNAEHVVLQSNKSALRARVPIAAGQEITWSYGPGYERAQGADFLVTQNQTVASSGHAYQPGRRKGQVARGGRRLTRPQMAAHGLIAAPVPAAAGRGRGRGQRRRRRR